MKKIWHIILLSAFLGAEFAAGADLRVPILLNKPDRLTTPTWPVTTGIPFKKGEFKSLDDLSLVDQDGQGMVCQMAKTADWEDGSLRWVQLDFNARLNGKYFLSHGKRVESDQDDLRVAQSDGGITVQAGPAEYTFVKNGGCFDSIRFDLNKDGKWTDDETLVGGAKDAFYLVTSRDQRAVLKGGKMTVELEGKRHAVIRVEGEYHEGDGNSVAAGVIYFHFYAGYPWTRISHKLIVIRNTNLLWFKDIGVEWPVKPGGAATASFNSDHEKADAIFSAKVQAGQDVVMLQDDFPHFGSMASHFEIFSVGAHGRAPLLSGAACGDWADVSSGRWGLAAQVPAFAEQFPKAFRISADKLTVKLWAAEGGKELDYRTPQILKNYFGEDWIPPGAKGDPGTVEIAKIPNTAEGTAKTHEVWLYPHAGVAAREVISSFGAPREEIYAMADPSWTARSQVMGPIHPKDTKLFPEEEEVISDYFDRTVLAGDKVFPNTGYLYWGRYPYNAGPWALKNGRWYPTLHRLARCLEYNLKRSVWLLHARSGDRKYYDYARRYTRLCGNLLFSNWDCAAKPKGWMVQGDFHNPVIWSGAGDGLVKEGYKPGMQGSSMCISYASSEDVIQFVYDYFLTGDYHSRDMVLAWKEAMIKEMNFDVDRALKFFPPSAFFRVLGSAYEFDHDPRLLDYGSKIMKRHIVADGKDILNPEIPTNYGKEGEVFSGFYYYYVATGDPLVKKALVELAKFRYRQGRIDGFFSRASCLQQCFALAFQETGDPGYAAYLAQVISDYARNYDSFKKRGVDFNALSQKTNAPWGQITMDGQAALNVGMPVSEEVAANFKGPTPYLPFAIKGHPTQRTHLLLKRDQPGAAVLDVYLNNWGDRFTEPRLFDLQDKPVKIEVADRSFKRVDLTESPNLNSIWFLCYGDQYFFKLRIPESIPAGVYRLDLGSATAFTVLNSEIPQILQVAPDGLVLTEGRVYYFNVPEKTVTVDFFASRPVQITDPSGQEVKAEDLKEGHYRLPTGGKAGAWRIEGGHDPFCPFGAIESFFRIEKITFQDQTSGPYPLIVALGDPKRLFPVDAASFKSADTGIASLPAINPDSPYLDSKEGFGKAMRLANQFAEVPVAGADGLPQQSGTAEFWFRPLWSTTDCNLTTLDKSTQRMQFYQGNPIALSYWIDPDNGGRTGRYNLVFLMVEVRGLGEGTRARFFFEAGKWHHLAVTWNVDGKNNVCNLFINGHKQPFSHYKRTLAPDAPLSKLVPSGKNVRLGSGHLYGYMATSEVYDELRVSRVVRYKEDFEPPSAPFTTDKDTSLLMHFDGNLEDAMGSAPVTGQFIKDRKLW
ncbi:MAG: hypothetical protein HY360_04135 [Verrucomicrobia bacterium]|nr:hypothetical protein [Verrucomicrobiota bacterium]